MQYFYPAIFHPVEKDHAVYVNFPDIDGCFTDGDNEKDAFEAAEDALNTWLFHLENMGEPIPPASKASEVKVPEGSFVAVIKADTTSYARAHNTKAIRKNVSIPSWLNTLATERNINFSNVLQNALMRELGVSAS